MGGKPLRQKKRYLLYQSCAENSVFFFFLLQVVEFYFLPKYIQNAAADLITATIYFLLMLLVFFFKVGMTSTSSRLDDSDLGSGLQSIMIRSQLDVSLLVTSRPDQSVDFSNLDLVKLLDSLLDLVLVAFRVNNKDQGVVVLDLFHGGLGGQGELDDRELVVAGSRGHRLGGALGVAGQLEGARALEVDRGADLSLLVLVASGLDGVGRFPSFGGHLGFWSTKIRFL